MHYWSTHEAKTKFSEVIRSAVVSGPQGISVGGHKRCVIMSQQHYDQLTGQKINLVQFLQNSPLTDCELDLTRDCSHERHMSFEE